MKPRPSNGGGFLILNQGDYNEKNNHHYGYNRHVHNHGVFLRLPEAGKAFEIGLVEIYQAYLLAGRGKIDRARIQVRELLWRKQGKTPVTRRNASYIVR